jgi:predicted nuclease of predicted toxin-antitoxin system
MRILLDENFPLALLRRLQDEGHEADHIILLGLRGTPDRSIVARLNSEDFLFLTNDQEFLDLSISRSRVIVSRVTQSLPTTARVEIWLTAVREYLSRDWRETIFEVFDDGRLRPWEQSQPSGPD